VGLFSRFVLRIMVKSDGIPRCELGNRGIGLSEIGYIGGLVDPAMHPNRRQGRSSDGAQWCKPCVDGRELFLVSRGDRLRICTNGAIRILVRGYVALPGSPRALEPEPLAELVLGHYLREGDIPADRLEGSFTLILMDGNLGRVLLYRNLVGAGYTYFTRLADGLLFSSNLANLVDALPATPPPNREVLPAFFLFRFVPGSQTLFHGIERLMPGELVTFGSDGFRRTQRQTFGSLVQGSRIRRDAPDRLEQTMDRILADCAAFDPAAANLLSGGVDSSFIQAHWNRARPAGGGAPLSYAVSVDHPHTRLDTDYALTAAQALGTRHTFVPADAPYADYLCETIGSTGEPPNHVQSAYFGHLARAMVANGLKTGLCGEGADSLFGLDTATTLHVARAARIAIPFSALRRLAAMAARAFGKRYLADSLLLADRVLNLSDPEHPINQAAVFTDRPSVVNCFGAQAVHAALAYRRALCDQYRVPDDPLDRTHAAGFLGEAMESASLWTTLFNTQGADLLCPFLDSRMLRFVANLDPRARYPFRKPKDLLKRALSQHVGRQIAYRPKLGFGQPIFEWLRPGGQLHPLVEAIGHYDFVDQEALTKARAAPNWFLYNLVCYDVWHKLFIERTIERSSGLALAAVGSPTAPAAASGEL
jgi:asparagine synthase (glutamine-hydrolysing)